MEVRQLKENKVLVEKLEQSLKTTDEFVGKANDKAIELEAQQHQQLYMQVSHLQKSVTSLSNILANEQWFFTETEKDIAEAYRLLGGNPDQPEDQNQQNQDQNGENQDGDDKNEGDQNQQNKDQQNQDQQNKDQQSKDQQNQDQQNKDQQNSDQQDKDQKQEGKSEEGKQEEEKPEDKKLNEQNQQGDFKKESRTKKGQKAGTGSKGMLNFARPKLLLRKMGDAEKQVREYIRQKKAEKMQQELMKKGIYAEPGENK